MHIIKRFEKKDVNAAIALYNLITKRDFPRSQIELVHVINTKSRKPIEIRFKGTSEEFREKLEFAQVWNQEY